MAKLWQRVMHNLFRERLLFVSNVFAMTVTFLFLGIFITVIMVSQTALRTLEQQAQVTIFFKDDFTEQSILDLKAKYQQDPRVSAVSYISKDDAYKMFSEANKDQPVLLDSISPSILPASLEVKTTELKFLPILSDEAQKIDGVEEVKFYKDVIERFRYWSSLIYILGVALVAVFFIISYSIILVTLRTLISSKGKEISIMKLVGASDMYVKRPLLLQGLFLGFISGTSSGLLLFILGSVSHFGNFYTGSLSIGVSSAVVSLSLLSYFGLLWGILIFSGMLLGFIGSISAVNKYLKF